jgi:hypothetical protein
MYAHEMFQADFLDMLAEVNRQPEIATVHQDDAEIGKDIFFFYAEKVLPLIKSDDSIYSAAEEFASEYSNDYFYTIRMQSNVEDTQAKLTALRGDVKQFLYEVIRMGKAPNSIALTKLSDFIREIKIQELPVDMQKKAKTLFEHSSDLEKLYVNVGTQAIKVLYEKGFPRIFYVVKRALKKHLGLKKSFSDEVLFEAHQYLNWCAQKLPQSHIVSRSLVSHRQFYKVVRNVDSHLLVPKWLPDSNEVILPDRDIELSVKITDFSKYYRYLMYFCEIGSRGILAVFCDCERGKISNSVKDEYLKMFNNPELKHEIQDYPLK